MSDFLAHLVARSAGAADQLTPRSWSRFEPPARPVEDLDAPPRHDHGFDGDPAQADRTDPAPPRQPAVPAAPDEHPGEWPPYVPLPAADPGPPPHRSAAAPGPPIRPELSPPPAEASPLGQPARRGSVSPVVPTRSGHAPVPAVEPEHGIGNATGAEPEQRNDAAPGHELVPAGRWPDGPDGDPGTATGEDSAPAPVGSAQPPPAPPGARATAPRTAPARRQPAGSSDVGYSRRAVEPSGDDPGRERRAGSAHRRLEGSPQGVDDAPIAAARRGTTPAARGRQLAGEAPLSTVSVPATDPQRGAGAPGDAGAVAGRVRARPRPDGFPPLDLLRPSVSAAVPVRAADRRAPDPGPTIEVTIGRVEIRTAPPTPPVRHRSAPRPGVLPLAEYLARRTGGR